MKVNTSIPIKFEEIEDYDERFQKVKIWLMHMGENYNRSFFAQEVVEEFMYTLKNTPLLGFIEEGKLGDKDFKGHEEILIIKDGEISTKYLGSAYGVIPESCNPRFEQKAGDDGVIRDYLVVDALMWTKFEDAIEILNEDGAVSQSMELHHEYDGYWDENNIFHFTKFKFDGACMLGRDVLPAMQRATVEKAFSVDLIESQVKEKINEFNEYIQKKFSKEVKILTIEEMLAKYNLSVEQLAEKGINAQDFSLEELEVKIQENFSEGEPEVTPEVTDGEGEVTPEVTPEVIPEVTPEVTEGEGEGEPTPEGEFQKNDILDKFKKRFELSHEDIRWKMYDKLDGHIQQSTNKEDAWYYIVSVYETHLIAEDDWGNGFYKVAYSVENNDITLGEVVEVHPMFLSSDEKGALELMRANFDTYEKENVELKEFKAKIESESHNQKAEDLFSSFNALEEDDLKELRAKVSEYSLEELESKTFEILGRKMATSKFAKKESKAPLAIKFVNAEKSTAQVDKYFEKHGITK